MMTEHGDRAFQTFDANESWHAINAQQWVTGSKPLKTSNHDDELQLNLRSDRAGLISDGT